MKAFRAPLILFAMLLVLGVAAYWDEMTTQNEKRQANEQNKLLLQVKESLTRIVVTRLNEEKNNIIELEKSPKGDWLLRKPVSGKVNEQKLQSFLNTIFDYKYQKKIENLNVNLGDFGLENPSLRVDFSYASNQTESLILGKDSPVGYETYLMRNGEENILIGSRVIRNILDLDLESIRFNKFDLPKIDNITKITFTNKEGSNFVFEQKKPSWSEFLHPDVRISSSEIADFIGELRRAKILEFIDTPSKELDAAISVKNAASVFLGSVSVSSAFEEAERTDFNAQFFLNNEELYVRYTPYQQRELLLRVERDLVHLFSRNLFSFQNKQIFSFDREKVSLVEIDDRKFERKDGGWFEKGLNGQVFNEAVEALLIELEFIQSISPPVSSEIKSEKALALAHSAKLLFESGDSTEVNFYRASDESVYLEQDSSVNFYKVDPEVLGRFSFVAQNVTEKTSSREKKDL